MLLQTTEGGVMNPGVAFVLLGAVACFARSVFRTKMQERAQPAELFAKLVAATTEKCATKPSTNAFIIWTQGVIGAISYDRAFVASLRPGNNQFKATSFGYSNRKWTQLDSQTVDPGTFAHNLNQLAMAPNSVRIKMLQKVGDAAPERPPHGTKMPWREFRKIISGHCIDEHDAVGGPHAH